MRALLRWFWPWLFENEFSDELWASIREEMRRWHLARVMAAADKWADDYMASLGYLPISFAEWKAGVRGKGKDAWRNRR